MATDENINDDNRLEELGGSDYEIVDDEPNIKGWEVKNGQSQKIGEVDELLFNPQSRNVRYLVVDLNDNDLNLENADRKVLIPIGLAELHGSGDIEDYDDADMDDDSDEKLSSDKIREVSKNNERDLSENDNTEDIIAEDEDRVDGDDDNYDSDVVVVPNITAAQLNALPVYDKGNVTPQTETTIRSILEGAGTTGAAVAMEGFYNHEHFNEDRFYNGRNGGAKVSVIKEDLNVGKREVETGGARITSRLVERPVQESINLKEEHVSVERTPVNRPVTDADQAFQESEIELTEHAEVPVISKEARVVEEVSLNKNVEEKEETIRDTVRSTEVDIEKLPGGDDKGYNR